jgi:preprotein translocase subunit SecF
LQNERVDTWLPRLTNLSIAIAITLFFSNVAWMVWIRGKPPIWLLSLAFVFGFVAAVFSHIYNAAHDSMPSD